MQGSRGRYRALVVQEDMHIGKNRGEATSFEYEAVSCNGRAFCCPCSSTNDECGADIRRVLIYHRFIGNFKMPLARKMKLRAPRTLYS